MTSESAAVPPNDQPPSVPRVPRTSASRPVVPVVVPVAPVVAPVVPAPIAQPGSAPQVVSVVPALSNEQIAEAAIQATLERFRITQEARRRLHAEEHPLVLPQLVTLRDRLTQPRLEIRWRIDGWLPVDARVMLSAQFKAGKTTAVGNLLRSLVDGDPWLGVASVTPISGAIVLLDTEMAQTQLDDWHREQGIRAGDRIVPISLRGHLSSLNLLDPGVRAAWVEHLDRVKAAYLILDCLRPVLDALGLDEQRDTGRFLVAFDALLREASISEAAVIHHMGHGAERARGDSRLRDWPDVEWRLVRETDNPASARFISAYGRDVEVVERQLAYDSTTRHLTLTGKGSRKDAKLQEALTAVRGVLAGAKESLSVRGLQDALAHSNHPRDSIREAIKHGVKVQLIIVEPGPKGAHLHRLGPTDPTETLPGGTG